MRHDVLRLDTYGHPQEWITMEEACTYYARDSVAWTIGDTFISMRGGTNAITGKLSQIDIHPILATRGASKVSMFDCIPTLTNRKLFLRDRHTCVMCGNKFRHDQLTREHIKPRSRGGKDEWSNVAAACKRCNGAKGNSLCTELGLSLLYLPYTPSIYEDLILSSRNIRADVHSFLAARLPKGSRLL
jgi:hypothetical protein